LPGGFVGDPLPSSLQKIGNLNVEHTGKIELAAQADPISTVLVLLHLLPVLGLGQAPRELWRR
jgi:hypothetical protein